MTNFKDFNSQINSNTFGIMWFTDKALTNETNGFKEFNYLLNGLLSQYLDNDDLHKDIASNIFFSENFGETFFLLHINVTKTTPEKLKELLTEQINLTSALKSENKVILTHNLTNIDLTSEVKRNFPSFEFKKLEF